MVVIQECWYHTEYGIRFHGNVIWRITFTYIKCLYSSRFHIAVYILLGSQVGSTVGVYVLLIDGVEGGSTVGVYILFVSGVWVNHEGVFQIHYVRMCCQHDWLVTGDSVCGVDDGTGLLELTKGREFVAGMRMKGQNASDRGRQEMLLFNSSLLSVASKKNFRQDSPPWG